jgi:hypothetical protein
MVEPSLPALPPDTDAAATRLAPEALLDIVERLEPDSCFVQHASRLLDRLLVAGELPLTRPAPPPPRLLTIAMVAEDFDGVYFSIQAIRLYHPEVGDDVQFLVLDPRPEDEALRGLGAWIESYRYWSCADAAGTSLHDLPFRHVESDYVLIMEPGVLFALGALAALVAFLRHHAPDGELMQGPRDEHDLGVFVCRRDAWPGVNPRLGGAGGLDGYLQEKFRRAGRRTVRLPFLDWQRRDPELTGGGPRAEAAARFRDRMIVHDELGMDLRPLCEQFEPLLGERWMADLRGALESPFALFDAVYCIHPAGDSRGRWLAEERFAGLGLHRVSWIAEVATPHDQRIGRTLTRRAIIAHAAWRRLERVLLLDAGVHLDRSALSLLRSARDRPWEVSWLDASGVLHFAEPGDRCRPIAPATHVDSAMLGIQRALYQTVLDEIPSAPSGVARWLRRSAACCASPVDGPALAFSNP